VAKLLMGLACLAFVLVVWVALSVLVSPFVIVIQH
jgi:hypothetical protein